MSEISSLAEIYLYPHEENPFTFLEHMQKEFKCTLLIEQSKGYFLTNQFEGKFSEKSAKCLGILLDKKKLTTKTVGMFLIKKPELIDT